MNYFIYNPISGNYSPTKRAALLKKISSDPNNIIFETNNKDEEASLTQKAIQLGAKKIIAIGGDGTINKVASVLAGTEIPLGLVAMGSGNGLARHLGIPMNSLVAVDKALNGKSIKIDACKINDKLFFCTAGMGFDAAVAELFDKRGKRGLINYILAVLIAMFKFRPIEVEFENGKTEVLFLLTIANANQYGNNAFISPYSNIQDGTFEIIKIKKNNIIRLMSISLRLFMKNIHKSSDVEIIPASSFKLIQKVNQPMHLDGESIRFESDTLEVSILPAALNVII
jgi:YegS/Rv2252/BmrU family lipid kinase